MPLCGGDKQHLRLEFALYAFPKGLIAQLKAAPQTLNL